MGMIVGFFIFASRRAARRSNSRRSRAVFRAAINIRTSRSSAAILWLAARMARAVSMNAPERAPCFQALRLPRGAPLPLPPCIRQRALPWTAGERHGAPDRVRAPQRGALARMVGSMGRDIAFSGRKC
jgi:hypothetical protein